MASLRNVIKALFDAIGAKTEPLSITPALLANAENAHLADTVLISEMDTTPTANSQHAVTSGGVKAALDGKANVSHVHYAISNGSGSIDIASNGEINITAPADGINFYIGNKSVTLYQDNAVNFIRALKNPDSTPTYDSDNLVTSGGVFQALQNVSSIHDTDSYVNTHEGDVSIGSEESEGQIFFNIDTKQAVLTKGNMPNLARAIETPDSEPTYQSDKLITSGAVYAALKDLESRIAALEPE